MISSILPLALKHYFFKSNENLVKSPARNIHAAPPPSPPGCLQKPGASVGVTPDSAIAPGTIGFDIDGVVADTMEAFIRLAREDYGITVHPEEITDFKVEECLDLDPEIIGEIFSRLLDDPLGVELAPMDGAPETIRDLCRFAPVTFITARPDPDPIAAWLNFHLGDETFRCCRLVASGDHDNKADFIRAHGLRYFIDDRAQTCRSLAAEKDITPIVFEQPWNRNKHDLFTVRDWQSIRALCAV